MAEAKPSAKSVLDKISQGHLECPICCCRFTDPRMLDCGHHFCLSCLEELCNKQLPKPDQIACPICKQQTVIRDGPKSLKRAFLLSSLVDEIKSQEMLLEDLESRKIETSQGGDKDGRSVRITKHTRKFGSVLCPRPIRQRSHPKLRSNRLYESQHDSDAVVNNPYRISLSKSEETTLDIDIYRQQLQHAIDSVEHARDRLRILVIEACRDITNKEEEEVDKLREKYQMLREEVTQIGEYRGGKLAEILQINRKKAEKVKGAVMEQKDEIEQGPDQEMRRLNPIMDPLLKNTRHDLSFLGVKCHDMVVDSIKQVGEVMWHERWRLKDEFGREGLGGSESTFSGVACFRTGDTAVVDTGKKKVLIFSPRGVYKADVGGMQAGEGKLTDPWGVAVSSDDHLLVTDEHEVKLYDANLKYISTFAPWQDDLQDAGEEITSKSTLTGVALDNKNRIVVADAGRQCVSVYNLQSGSLISKFQTDDANFGLTISNKERLIFTDYDTGNVVCTTIEGRELSRFTPTFLGKGSWKPFGVCCDAAGDIYLSVHSGPRRTGEVHHYDPGGVYVGRVAYSLYNPLGITLAPSGHLVVADLHSIKVFERF